jgi:flagellar basal-body rod protein FlgB
LTIPSEVASKSGDPFPYCANSRPSSFLVRDLLSTRQNSKGGIMSNIVFDQTLRMIEDRLNLNSMNQKLISGNLANLDTPGYQAKELSFESALRESLEEQILHMVRSNDHHMSLDDPAQQMESREVVETGPVDLDTQMVNLTKNSIEYQHMIGMLNKKFTMLKTAITDGGA